MDGHLFNMRLGCSYSGDKNSISDLEVKHRVRDRWRRLDLSITTPGFDIFVYSALACQHTCFLINCAERGLLP